MKILNQHNWSTTYLGDTKISVATDGCLVTCIAMILNTTPDIVIARLKAVGGFSGALVIWGKLEQAFPGIKVRLGWSYNNDDVKANTPCIVRVNGAPIGGTMHFVVYEGNQKLADPWDGKEKSTGVYQVLESATGPVYCIITGSWTPPQDSNYYKGYDLSNQDSMKVAVNILVDVLSGVYIKKTDAVNPAIIQSMQAKINNSITRAQDLLNALKA